MAVTLPLVVDCMIVVRGFLFAWHPLNIALLNAVVMALLRGLMNGLRLMMTALLFGAGVAGLDTLIWCSTWANWALPLLWLMTILAMAIGAVDVEP